MSRALLVLGLASMVGACAILPEPDEALYEALGTDDIALAAAAMQDGLESHHEGDRVAWRNPASGHAGAIVVGRTFVDARGSFCRDYRETIVLSDGRLGEVDNTACRDEDGAWQWI